MPLQNILTQNNSGEQQQISKYDTDARSN